MPTASGCWPVTHRSTAAQQRRNILATLSRDTPSWSDMNTFPEVVIVGGGAAGSSAAPVLGRARAHVLLIDAGEPSNAPSTGIGGLLGHDGTTPSDFYRRAAAELTAYPPVSPDSRRPSRPSNPAEQRAPPERWKLPWSPRSPDSASKPGRRSPPLSPSGWSPSGFPYLSERGRCGRDVRMAGYERRCRNRG